MSSTTSRAGLRKPDTIDNVNVVTDLNNNWDTLDLNMNFRSCTSSTRPSTLWDGLCIHETDTNRQYVWNGAPATSGWYELYGSGGTISQVNLSGSSTGAMTLTNNVTGDSNKRVQVRADGRVEFGSGSGATDTFVRRLGSNSLITDGAFTVAGTTTVQSTTDSTALSVSGGGTFLKSLTVGGSASLGGGQGVLGLKDATTPPTSAPNNGVLVYSQSSQPQYTNASNNTYLISGSQSGSAVSSLTGTTETTIISVVIPANEIVQDGCYRLHAFGNLSTPATAATVTFRTKQNGNLMLSSGAIPTAASILTSKQWMLDTFFRFRSPGASANLYSQLMTVDRFDGSSTPTAARVIHDSHGASLPSINTTVAVTLSVTVQLSNANAAYVLTTMGYYFERVV